MGAACEWLSNLFCHVQGQRLSRNEHHGYKNQQSSRNNCTRVALSTEDCWNSNWHTKSEVLQ